MDAMFRMTPPPLAFRCGMRSKQTVVHALDVDLKHPVEVGFGRGVGPANVRHARVVHQYIDPALRGNSADHGNGLLLIGHVNDMTRSVAPRLPDFVSGQVGLFAVQVQDVHVGSRPGKGVGNGQANTAGSARN